MTGGATAAVPTPAETNASSGREVAALNGGVVEGKDGVPPLTGAKIGNMTTVVAMAMAVAVASRKAKAMAGGNRDRLTHQGIPRQREHSRYRDIRGT